MARSVSICRLKAIPRSLRPEVGSLADEPARRASVGGICALAHGAWRPPEDPHRQSARTRADQLELPPPNDSVEEK